MEYQINDRLSFMRFLGLTLADDVPDSKTVWFFREQLMVIELTPLLRIELTPLSLPKCAEMSLPKCAEILN